MRPCVRAVTVALCALAALPACDAGASQVPQESPATSGPLVPPPTGDGEPVGEESVLAETAVGPTTFRLVARTASEEAAPTATVVVEARGSGGAVLDSAVVGDEGGFFWHPLTGSGAVCTFEAAGGEVVRIEVSVLLSPSLGCSPTASLRFADGSFTAGPPAEVASAFVAAWVAGDEDRMAELAEAGSSASIAELDPPPAGVDPGGCEGAAGSTHCVWEWQGTRLVVRVSNQTLLVTEVRVDPAG